MSPLLQTCLRLESHITFEMRIAKLVFTEKEGVSAAMLLSVATGIKHLLDYMEICAGRHPELDRRNPEQNINSLSENATAIIEHLYDVFYGRTCGGLLTQISGSDENHTVTLIAMWQDMPQC